MWSVALFGVALLVIYITQWCYRWWNPKCNGKLPPGSMGLPLLGETLQFITPNKSMDIPPFIKKRMERYGPLFRTSLAGRPVVISADPDFNYYIFQQEGTLVEIWYLDSFGKLTGQNGLTNTTGHVHKYLRTLITKHFGPECLKEKLLPQVEKLARRSLQAWSTQESVELKHASSTDNVMVAFGSPDHMVVCLCEDTMIFDFTSRMLFSFDPKDPSENISEKFTNFLQGLISFPVNIPGTAFHRCLKNQKAVLKLMKNILEERRASPEKLFKGDMLDQIVRDMKTEDFLTEKFVLYFMLGVLFASFESISSTLTLAVKLLTENPSVVKELTEEHEAILRNREDVDGGLTWTEYKSMTFTLQVINETLRLGSIAPGILRRAMKDIQVNGYTIPAGWTIMAVPSALQLNPKTYEDPLAFNPWRWKDMASKVTAKNFLVFGAGMRSCTGADFSKMIMATFLHVLVTKYRWTLVKGGEVVRTPVLGFGKGLHIKVSEKA